MEWTICLAIPAVRSNRSQVADDLSFISQRLKNLNPATIVEIYVPTSVEQCGYCIYDCDGFPRHLEACAHHMRDDGVPGLPRRELCTYEDRSNER